MTGQYFKDRDLKNMKVVDEMLTSLPPLCTEYFNDVSIARAPSTMANYARQLARFFGWLESNDFRDKKPVTAYDAADLAAVTSDDVTLFLHELRHSGDGDATLRAYCRSLSSFYTHLNHKGKLSENPVNGVIRPRTKRSPKIYMEADDVKRFRSTVDTAAGLSERMSKYRDTTGAAARDKVIVSVLYDTGIRVSELVGLDLTNIDLTRCRMSVLRKGGAVDNVYFSDETHDEIVEYLDFRKKIKKDDKAFLLVTVGKYKGQRMTVRSVENIIKKYALAAGVTNSEKISPHKMRHTRAMGLLKATGNIALVQKQLGHKNITSTTVYAEADDSDLSAIRNVGDYAENE